MGEETEGMKSTPDPAHVLCHPQKCIVERQTQYNPVRLVWVIHLCNRLRRHPPTAKIRSDFARIKVRMVENCIKQNGSLPCEIGYGPAAGERWGAAIGIKGSATGR